MRYEGIINNLSKIVVTDPHYKQDVWCRYEKKFDNVEKWKIQFIIKEVNEVQKYEGENYDIRGLDFSILIKREKSNCDLLDISMYSYSKGAKQKETEIGIDTAQVCMGINEKADKINEFSKKMNNSDDFETIFSEYNPPFAIQTGSDGKFGSVVEGTLDGKTDYIFIDAFFDEMADINTIDELKDYLVEQLNIENLEICKEPIRIEQNNVDYSI